MVEIFQELVRRGLVVEPPVLVELRELAQALVVAPELEPERAARVDLLLEAQLVLVFRRGALERLRARAREAVDARAAGRDLRADLQALRAPGQDLDGELAREVACAEIKE